MLNEVTLLRRPARAGSAARLGLGPGRARVRARNSRRRRRLSGLSQKFAHVFGSADTLAPDGTRARVRRRRSRLRVVPSDRQPPRLSDPRWASDAIRATIGAARLLVADPTKEAREDEPYRPSHTRR